MAVTQDANRKRLCDAVSPAMPGQQLAGSALFVCLTREPGIWIYQMTTNSRRQIFLEKENGMLLRRINTWLVAKQNAPQFRSLTSRSFNFLESMDYIMLFLRVFKTCLFTDYLLIPYYMWTSTDFRCCMYSVYSSIGKHSCAGSLHFGEVGETERKMSKIWVVLVVCVTEEKESTEGW